MLSKNTVKKITSLSQKKYRQREGLFVAEGIKVISELLNSHFELDALYVEENAAFAKRVPDLLQGELRSQPENLFITTTSRDLAKVSFLKTSQSALAIFKIPSPAEIKSSGLTVVLDDVRDPGNLGTIIRLCDWFGIEQLICSRETVDCYNPKVVQATMGSLTRVSVIYTDLENYLSQEKRPIFGTFMDGNNLYVSQLPSEGVIIMGNEANGISEVVAERVSHRIAIPRFGNTQVTESLNVATATAIFLSEWRRG